jgi:hypothetical protein
VTEIQTGARDPDPPSGAQQAAGRSAEAASRAAGNVAGTAADQARQVTGEVSAQARNVASDVRQKVSDQARTQNDRLVDGIRRMADELDQMRAERRDSPAASVVSRIADGGRQVADYLADRGPDGVVNEVQDFARRRPGAFLATALVAGFVVGRLGKGVIGAASSDTGTSKPRTDAFVSQPAEAGDTTPVYPAETAPAPAPGYPTATPTATPAATPTATSTATTPVTTAAPVSTTEYAATGTGTPVPVTEAYPDEVSPIGGDDPSTRGGQR